MPVHKDGRPIWTAVMQNVVAKQPTPAFETVGRKEQMKIRRDEPSLLQMIRWTRRKNWDHIGGCEKEDELKTTTK